MSDLLQIIFIVDHLQLLVCTVFFVSLFISLFYDYFVGVNGIKDIIYKSYKGKSFECNMNKKI